MLNAAVVLRRFRPQTRHVFDHGGRRFVATIAHRLELATQTMTEQVTWRVGRSVHRDPVERLRLLFPQELGHLVAASDSATSSSTTATAPGRTRWTAAGWSWSRVQHNPSPFRFTP